MLGVMQPALPRDTETDQKQGPHRDGPPSASTYPMSGHKGALQATLGAYGWQQAKVLWATLHRPLLLATHSTEPPHTNGSRVAYSARGRVLEPLAILLATKGGHGSSSLLVMRCVALRCYGCVD